MMKIYLRELVNLTYNGKANKLLIGGNQLHYNQFIRRYDGCAPIAATNILLYLSHVNKLANSALSWPLNRANVDLLAERIYEQMTPFQLYRCFKKSDIWQFKLFGFQLTIPPSLGVFSAVIFKHKMKRLAKTFKIQLKQRQFKPALWADQLVDWQKFIAEQLAAGRPIALLNTFARVEIDFFQPFSDQVRQQSLRHHWVVIVGIEAVKDDFIISALSWGGVVKISLNQLWRANRNKWLFKSKMIAYQI